jgi:hypothetical protein
MAIWQKKVRTPPVVQSAEDAAYTKINTLLVDKIVNKLGEKADITEGATFSSQQIAQAMENMETSIVLQSQLKPLLKNTNIKAYLVAFKQALGAAVDDASEARGEDFTQNNITQLVSIAHGAAQEALKTPSTPTQRAGQASELEKTRKLLTAASRTFESNLIHQLDTARQTEEHGGQTSPTGTNSNALFSHEDITKAFSAMGENSKQEKDGDNLVASKIHTKQLKAAGTDKKTYFKALKTDLLEAAGHGDDLTIADIKGVVGKAEKHFAEDLVTAGQGKAQRTP